MSTCCRNQDPTAYGEVVAIRAAWQLVGDRQLLRGGDAAVSPVDRKSHPWWRRPPGRGAVGGDADDAADCDGAQAVTRRGILARARQASACESYSSFMPTLFAQFLSRSPIRR
jgi:hypothetical protein